MQKHMPQLLAVMTPFPYQIDGRQSIDEALSLMRQHNIHHLPVVVNGNIETIVSDRDIMRCLQIGHRGATSEELRIGDISPLATYFADVSDPLDQVLELMLDKQTEAIVVLKEGTAVGIFTETDACKTLVELLRQTYGDAEDDDAA